VAAATAADGNDAHVPAFGLPATAHGVNFHFSGVGFFECRRFFKKNILKGKGIAQMTPTNKLSS
jgi:hypothetical protein